MNRRTRLQLTGAATGAAGPALIATPLLHAGLPWPAAWAIGAATTLTGAWAYGLWHCSYTRARRRAARRMRPKEPSLDPRPIERSTP